MWSDYNNCKDSFKRACILEKIANIEPFLSAYYETTKDIIENSPIDRKRKKRLEGIGSNTEEDQDQNGT
jgi:hypothetical protein